MGESSQPTEASARQRHDAIRLALVPGIGPRLLEALLQRFGSPTAVLNAAPSELRSVPRVGPKLTQAISQAAEMIDVESLLETCRRLQVSVLLMDDGAFPRVLREIPDPPPILFIRGQLLPQDAVAIAMVGSRHATQYGLAQAERLAARLARAGVTIISGLARGIDAAAHKGALSAGGRTIAVLASGLESIYPPEHASLADEVAGHGALVSESPPAGLPRSGSFPRRNRLISGLSLGVLVVEAAKDSGALITAGHASEQGRDVFAVPGRVDSRMSHGCHRLIRDGAKLVETAEDVLEELGPLVAPASAADGQELHHPAELLLNDLERQVLGVIESSPTPIDEVISKSGLSPAQVLATLSVLEMRHLVRRLSGTTICRR